MSRNTSKKRSIELQNTSVREKISYGLGDVGSNFIWMFTASFLTLYYVDTVGMNAAFVGTMMFIVRILDGISDLTMGVIIEKTRTRWGKARPWLLFGSVPFALSLILLFNVPGKANQSAQGIYVYVTYIFLTVICYTVVNLAYHAMLPLISSNSQDRSVISAIRQFMVLALVIVMNNITPRLLEAFGGQNVQKSWSILSAIYAVLAFILIMVTFFGTKEKVKPHNAEQEVVKVPLKVAVKAVFAHKYFYIAALVCVLMCLYDGLGGAYVYYAKDILGDINIYGYISTAQFAPMMIGMLFIPALFKRYGKKNVMLAGIILTTLSFVAMWIYPDNASFFIAMNAVRALGFAPTTAGMFTLAGDVVDYGDWKFGVRAEGLATSSNSFGMKVGTGVGSAIVGWGLEIGHYDPSAAVQSESAINATIAMCTIVPLICAVIILLLLVVWDMDKKLPQIMEDLAARHE